MCIKVSLKYAVKKILAGSDKLLNQSKSFGNFNVKADLNYSSDELDAHKLDIYTPVHNSNNITLFYIHGGAYAFGSKEENRQFISWFVHKGFSVISINYRLANLAENISFKDQMQDVLQALNFVAKNKLFYKLSLQNLYIMGDSAGGHMALMTDIIYKDEDARNFFEITDLPNIKIKGICTNSPMYDYRKLREQSKKYLLKNSIRTIFTSDYENDEYIRQCSPRFYYSKLTFKPAPTFVSTSYNDFFYEQSRLCQKDFIKFGYEIDYFFEPSVKKEIGHVYNHFIFDEEGLKCNLAMVDFFINHCSIDK